MKYFHFLFALLFIGCLFNQNLQAQTTEVNDSVDIGLKGDIALHDVWYSMEQGEVTRRDASEWDLAFQIEAREAGIRINSVKGVKLWLFSKNVDDWNNTDTTGKLTAEKQLYNSDTSWNYGAFNMVRNWSDPFDYGWGQYNQVRQIVVGKNIYVIQLANKQYYKILIDSIDTGASRFKIRYAGIDNTNPVTFYVDRKQFTNRNFAYYDFATNRVFDREPVNRNWDLLFCKYHTTIDGQKYPVAGVLHNYIRTFFGGSGAMSAKLVPINPNIKTDEGIKYRTEINTIGSDWKTFDEPTRKYLIRDSLVCFVRTYSVHESYYKLVFTGFGGPSDHTFYFSKLYIRNVGRSELLKSNLRLYPNPAGQFLNFDLPQELSTVHYSIINMNGQSVLTGMSEGQINISNLPKGVYNLHLDSDGKREIIRWIKD